jgi:hypothetical protein
LAQVDDHLVELCPCDFTAPHKMFTTRMIITISNTSKPHIPLFNSPHPQTITSLLQIGIMETAK